MSSIDPDRWQAVSPYLDQALALPDGEREAWLAALRVENPALAADLQALLDEHDSLVRKGFLEQSLLSEPGLTSLEGRTIGTYTLRRLIATGGMGAVYEAWQKQPHRLVALKVMRSGITSRSALRRFEYEAQLLARLRHPGIAQVYEAGTHDDGTGPVPFFAMEYVAGAVSLTEYASEKSLTTRSRLELFIKVCEAVHHGHQRGIIHRDLKPSNILVDATGQPKVIDFGVARSTDSDVALTTLLTSTGQLVGTLQYMSPEQCEADPQDLDIRSDIYALGMVLYELLCGRLPYDLSGAAIHEAARIIRERPPVRPSVIHGALHGDLETIVLKALEKERRRRYQSAADLASDLQRYLDQDPISARPPSAGYRTRMFVRRHRFGVTAAGLAAVGVMAFAVAMGIQAQTTARERDRATRVSEFLVELFNVSDPGQARGNAVTAREVLDRGAARLEKDLEEEPELRAQLLETMGRVYMGLGLYPRAEKLLERSGDLRRKVLGEDVPLTLTSRYQQAWAILKQGRDREAEQRLSRVLAAQGRVLGEDHPDTLASLNLLAVALEHLRRPVEAGRYYREAYEKRRRILGKDAHDTLLSQQNVGFNLFQQGNLPEAERMIREAIAGLERLHGKDHPATLWARSSLVYVLEVQRRFAEGEAVTREVLEARRRVFGPDHQDTIANEATLARLVGEQNRYEEAEGLFLKALAHLRRVLGPNHPSTINAMYNMASTFYWEHGKYGQAAQMLREAYALARQAHDDPHAQMTSYNLGCLAARQGYRKEALDWLRKTIEIGYHEPDSMRQDPDLESLHGDPEYDRLLAAAQTNAGALAQAKP